jgi:hypothetical protein
MSDDNTIDFPTPRVRGLESLLGIRVLAQNLSSCIPGPEDVARLVDGLRAMQGLAINDDHADELADVVKASEAALQSLCGLGAEAERVSTAMGRVILDVQLLPDSSPPKTPGGKPA